MDKQTAIIGAAVVGAIVMFGRTDSDSQADQPDEGNQVVEKLEKRVEALEGRVRTLESRSSLSTAEVQGIVSTQLAAAQPVQEPTIEEPGPVYEYSDVQSSSGLFRGNFGSRFRNRNFRPLSRVGGWLRR